MRRINLGDRVKDRITGLVGITTGMTEYLNGCRQWLIKPEKLDKDGKPIDGQWIDEQVIDCISAQVLPSPFVTPTLAPTAGGLDRPEHARAK